MGFWTGECPEWQRELTVNQPSYDFEGSSPSSPTTLRPTGYAWRSQNAACRVKRVRRSLSEAKAKTDGWKLFRILSRTIDLA
jgi:hypothetical protein